MAGFLANKDLQLIIFGGKGGTGKTTSAAATGLYLAKTNRERKVLVGSTDPAHSLADSFRLPIGSRITPIPGLDNLWAQEINATALLEEFRGKYGAVMRTLADRGTYFDQEDINDFFSLPLPGVDEVMAIIEIATILKRGEHDVIVLDTAPTGHTLQLLALPATMKDYVRVFDLMQEKHRYLMRHFTGRYVKDKADEFLEKMTNDLELVRVLLRNARVTEFVPVTIPEPMAINETERLLATLKGHRISVKSIIVNRVMQERACHFCRSRHERDDRYLQQIREKFSAHHLVTVPLCFHEIRGLDDLSEFATILFGKASRYRRPLPWAPLPEPLPVNRIPDLYREERRFLLLGGKGGVGKTSLAAAAAVRLAQGHPGKNFLIFSTDPAHSLSDCFDQPIGETITPVGARGHLDALEINAALLYEEFKRDFQEDLEELFDRFLAGGVDVKFDREVMTSLLDLSPPGLDEIMALKRLTDLKERGKYDLVILDTAPTGHLLRFLELPGIMRDWLRYFFRLLLKYRGQIRLARAAERLVELSKDVRKTQEALLDARRSELLAVTIPDAMGLLELERMLNSLTHLRIPCHHILINLVLPPTQCSFCSAKREEQQRYIRQAKERWSLHYRVAEVPWFPHDIRGLADLTELSGVLSGEAVAA